jgi:hypothetical protein
MLIDITSYYLTTYVLPTVLHHLGIFGAFLHLLPDLYLEHDYANNLKTNRLRIMQLHTLFTDHLLSPETLVQTAWCSFVFLGPEYHFREQLCAITHILLNE